MSLYSLFLNNSGQQFHKSSHYFFAFMSDILDDSSAVL